MNGSLRSNGTAVEWDAVRGSDAVSPVSLESLGSIGKAL